MGSKVEDLVDAIRRIISRWTITTTALTATAHALDTILTVDSTLRFHANDEIILRNANEDTEPPPGILHVRRIIDDTHLELTEALQLNWPLSDNPTIFKSTRGTYVKRVFFGEPPIISQNDLPAITVNMTTRNSEWMTTRATKERYNIEIGIFVEDGDYETASRQLAALTDLIQTGLKNNIYPLVNDYDLTALTADAISGDNFIKIADSSILQSGDRILIENKFKVMESQVRQIIDANTICIDPVADGTYRVSDGSTLIRARRFIHNSWPADINYGQISKGTLMRAAVISYFAEEYETQFNTSWSDPQLK